MIPTRRRGHRPFSVPGEREHHRRQGACTHPAPRRSAPPSPPRAPAAAARHAPPERDAACTCARDRPTKRTRSRRIRAAARAAAMPQSAYSACITLARASW